MHLPDDKTLDIMWTVSTSSAIESRVKPHIIFAKLLYAKLTKTENKVGLAPPYEDDTRRNA